MAEYLIQDTTLTNIANAIRSKTGNTEPIDVNDFPDAITAISSGSSVVVGEITTTTSSGSMTISDIANKDNFILQFIDYADYPSSTGTRVKYVNITYRDSSLSASSMSLSEFGTDTNVGYITYDKTAGSITLDDDVLETFPAGKYMYIAWDSNQSSSSLIAFSIEGTSYQAESGMTWGEWVESEYNTDGYSVYEDGRIYTPDFNGYIMRPDDNVANDSDVITSDASYYICPTDGEEL